MDFKIDCAKKRRDKRGFLVDFLKYAEVGGKPLGQVYFVTFEKINAARGNHYHKIKSEWFVVVKGKVRMILMDIRTKERVEYILDGDSDKYERIYIGPGIAHAFISLSQVAMMINYSDKPYEPKNTDTIVHDIS